MLPIIVVVGPTAVGKTKLSVALAKHFHGEIINADSMQFYKELDIGTAKIKEVEKEGIPHHLFDIVKVDEMYTVYDYQKDARKKIEEIRSRGHVPILVGGTGLYIKAALYDYEFQEEEKVICDLSDEELKAYVVEHLGNQVVDLNNRRRLERAYTKIQNHSFHHQKKDLPLYDFICIGLTTDRECLYQKIDERVDLMMKEGLLEEVKPFYDQKIHSKALMTGIGYKELYAYFDQEITLEDAIDQIKKNSRHYAKRQYTFFRHQLPVTWFESNYEDFQKTIDTCIKYIEKGVD